ncbi:hypothetical protein SAMN05444672_1387 [Bacillus sp. OK838]|nr:hypothetical protein SAMN05444672_1387 [Bacillus sp. OK838]
MTLVLNFRFFYCKHCSSTLVLGKPLIKNTKPEMIKNLSFSHYPARLFPNETKIKEGINHF